MSILITGITAKELLDVFKWARYGANNCMIGQGVIATELPDHGDLIDRDALRKEWKFSESCNRCERDAYRCQYYEEMSPMDVCGMLDDAPVVIPAERSEDVSKSD